jgi:hypothetical protein
MSHPNSKFIQDKLWYETPMTQRKYHRYIGLPAPVRTYADPPGVMIETIGNADPTDIGDRIYFSWEKR